MRRMRTEAEEAEEETGEINLVPYMDIVTNIIIFLLASVVNAVPLSNINVTLPSISSGAGGAASEDPSKPPLNLTVTVGASGFTVAASGGVLPLIPKKANGEYDFPALTAKLKEIKKEFPDETKATFNADSDTPYTVVVETLDFMREDENSGMLFPDIAFAAGIL